VPDEHFFSLSSYHVALAAVGAGIILAYWVPRFFSGREPAASALLILLGMLVFALVPGMPEGIDPRSAPRFWEVVSEMAVIVALFGSGIRIDNLSNYQRWKPTLRLLVVLMPLTIAAVALLGWWLAGMTFAGALLLGAVLAPTDPVLAGDVQVGPPTEGGEHPVRFSLTTEAGLNDGLAFPFVYLALIVAAEGFVPQQWGLEWVLRDVVYRIAWGPPRAPPLGGCWARFSSHCPRAIPSPTPAPGSSRWRGYFSATAPPSWSKAMAS
jgi:NhaP-type Na+/H+ or K+/H+ antiporter